VAHGYRAGAQRCRGRSGDPGERAVPELILPSLGVIATVEGRPVGRYGVSRNRPGVDVIENLVWALRPEIRQRTPIRRRPDSRMVGGTRRLTSRLTVDCTTTPTVSRERDNKILLALYARHRTEPSLCGVGEARMPQIKMGVASFSGLFRRDRQRGGAPKRIASEVRCFRHSPQQEVRK
jgi:hypothetical protein